RINPQAVRDFFTKYQDRILFGTDSDFDKKFASDEEKKQWQNKAARFYSRYLEYFETDRIDIIEPYSHAKDWLRLPGVKLPPAVLEKVYHAKAERLIPGLVKQGTEALPSRKRKRREFRATKPAAGGESML